MTEPETQAPRRPVLTPRYLATLIGSALLILVVGSALRPRKPSTEPVQPPSQTEVRRLQRLAERQALETTSNHFAGIAADVAPHIVQVGARSSTGLVWSSDLVIAAGSAAPGSEPVVLVTSTGDQLATSRSVGGGDLPVAAFQLAGQLDPVRRREPTAPELAPGQWLVAVWRGGGGAAFSSGHYVETRRLHCDGLASQELATTLELAAPMAGAGVFDLDGALLAVVLPCDGRYVALGTDSVALAIAHGRSLEGRLHGLFGLGVTALDDALRAHLGVERGVLVSEVWDAQAAARAGLRPGDVIVSVDGEPVASPDQLQPLVAAAGRPDLRLGVWRAGRTRELDLAQVAAQAPAPEGPGLKLQTAAEGYAIAEVAGGSAAAAAGIRPGDRLVRVDFAQPPSAAAAQRALLGRGERPVFVEVARDARRFGALLGGP